MKASFPKIFLLICLISFKIFAHDAGMSSLNVEFADDNLTVRSNYAMREIEKIASLEDEKQMSGLAKNGVVLLIDGEKIEPNESDFLFAEGDAVTFTQIFRGINGNKVEIKSPLIASLNPGHRQFFNVYRSDEAHTVKEILTTENDSMTVDFENLEPNTSWTRFLPLGIEHIIFGFDHLLFLLALLLAVKTFSEIVKIVSSFTVAHSITLSLATLNIIKISTILIEPLIALSIVFVGLENIFRKEIKDRWMVTYFFGLIHGFGFASALQEVGIGKGFGVIEPLLSFNLGVEIGQIAVVLLALPLLWKLQKHQFFSTRFVPMGSVLVVLAGLYWLVERILF
jgi:hydrogenase/urease accessory protein HupE